MRAAVRPVSVRPDQLGGTIGIVGGLIIGQAAVEANLVSPIVVVVVAVTRALATLAIPNEEITAPFRLLKFGFILLGGTMGVFGCVVGTLSGHQPSGTRLKSFGIPYLTPFDAQRNAGYRGESDGIVMAPLRFMTRRPLYARKEQQVRLKTKGGRRACLRL